MTRRALAWARRKILDELAKTLEAQSRQAFDDREELAARVEGRTCRITLWAREASIAISLSRPIIPDGLAVNEASVWGPQQREAWSSAEAAPTGAPEFDAHFVVLPTDPDGAGFAEKAQDISPAMRSALIREWQHGGLRDAEIGPVEVVLSVRAPGRARPALPARARLAWALGAALVGFNHLPSIQDLRGCRCRQGPWPCGQRRHALPRTRSPRTRPW